MQVRAHALEVLQKTDDEELLYYLLQLVQARAAALPSGSLHPLCPLCPSAACPLPLLPASCTAQARNPLNHPSNNLACPLSASPLLMLQITHTTPHG